METGRRLFLGLCLALTATRPASAAMQEHIILLGDSIFDNGSYTGGKPDVIAWVKRSLPAGWKASLLAVDGARTGDLPAQLARLPRDATRLVLSIGGNDALGARPLLQSPASTVGQAVELLAAAAARFEADYRRAIGACLRTGLPLTTCTIYNGNFADRREQLQASTALTLFNDAILRVARDHGLTVLDLRDICDQPADYANPIEPSSEGAGKIAKAILAATGQVQAELRGARLLGKART